MPQLGETVTEGTVLRWMKKVGDSIDLDEAIVEISTDKVDTEVPSPVAGVVSDILVGEGETIEVGTAMVVIASPDEGAPAATPAGVEADEAPRRPKTMRPGRHRLLPPLRPRHLHNATGPHPASSCRRWCAAWPGSTTSIRASSMAPDGTDG